MNHSRSRKAFTLVEILVVIVILGIMAAMVTTAVSGVTSTAKQSRTKNIIAIVDSVLAEQYENLKYRQLPVESPSFLAPTSDDGVPLGLEISATEAARVRLMMTRDLHRMEMPDRYSDFIEGTTLLPVQQVVLRAVATPTILSEDGSELKQETDIRKRQPIPVSWEQLGRTKAFRKRTMSNFNRLRAEEGQVSFNGRVAATNQGAECLYLILATSYVGGIPALESIPPSNIGDTDGDLMLEILDGWGRPLEFVRWPIGYFNAEDQFTQKRVDKDGNAFLIQRDVAADAPDDFDLFRADFAYAPNAGDIALATRVPNPNNTTESARRAPPWSMRPLIFSRGPDGESGIYTNPNDLPSFSYPNAWRNNWTADTAHCGDERERRDANFTFPDPYLRTEQLTRRPGERVRDAQGKPTSASADNITNYELQVSQR
jgi:prepilin-type N-terminal cleavage/methylation domain-containing protein